MHPHTHTHTPKMYANMRTYGSVPFGMPRPHAHIHTYPHTYMHTATYANMQRREPEVLEYDISHVCMYVCMHATGAQLAQSHMYSIGFLLLMNICLHAKVHFDTLCIPAYEVNFAWWHEYTQAHNIHVLLHRHIHAICAHLHHVKVQIQTYGVVLFCVALIYASTQHLCTLIHVHAICALSHNYIHFLCTKYYSCRYLRGCISHRMHACCACMQDVGMYRSSNHRTRVRVIENQLTDLFLSQTHRHCVHASVTPKPPCTYTLIIKLTHAYIYANPQPQFPHQRAYTNGHQKPGDSPKPSENGNTISHQHYANSQQHHDRGGGDGRRDGEKRRDCEKRRESDGRRDGERRRESDGRRDVKGSREPEARRDDVHRAHETGNRRKSSQLGIDFLPNAPPSFDELYALDQDDVLSLCTLEDNAPRARRKSTSSTSHRHDDKGLRYAKCAVEDEYLDCSTQIVVPAPKSSANKYAPKETSQAQDSDRSSLIQFSTASTIPANVSIESSLSSLASLQSAKHSTDRSSKINIGGGWPSEAANRVNKGFTGAAPDQAFKKLSEPENRGLGLQDERISMPMHASYGSAQNDSLVDLYNNLYNMVESESRDQYGNRANGLTDTANRVVNGLAAKLNPGANGWRVEKHEDAMLQRAPGSGPSGLLHGGRDAQDAGADLSSGPASWVAQNQLGA